MLVRWNCNGHIVYLDSVGQVVALYTCLMTLLDCHLMDPLVRVSHFLSYYLSMHYIYKDVYISMDFGGKERWFIETKRSFGKGWG